MKKKGIHVRVLRGSPLSSDPQHYEQWTVPWDKGMSILNILQYINEHFSAGLAYYGGCGIGICRGCLALVNGKPVKICTEIVKDHVTIEPLKRYPIIKDLVVDTSRKVRDRD